MNSGEQHRRRRRGLIGWLHAANNHWLFFGQPKKRWQRVFAYVLGVIAAAAFTAGFAITIPHGDSPRHLSYRGLSEDDDWWLLGGIFVGSLVCILIVSAILHVAARRVVRNDRK